MRQLIESLPSELKGSLPSIAELEQGLEDKSWLFKVKGGRFGVFGKVGFDWSAVAAF